MLQFFDKVMPLFDIEFSKCSYSQALAPACGALVCFIFGHFCTCICNFYRKEYTFLVSIINFTTFLCMCVCLGGGFCPSSVAIVHFSLCAEHIYKGD